MTDFNVIFPGFLSAAQNLRLLLLPVAFVLIVTGLVLAVTSAGRSIRGLLMPIGRVALLTTTLVFVPIWGKELSHIVNEAIVNTLQANPAAVHAKYQSSLQAQKGTNNGGWWENLFSTASYFEAIISGVLLLLGMLAGVIVFYAYLVQTFILYMGYALSPIFIGFLAVRSLSSIGTNFLLGIGGVISWPLGWGCASLLTDGLISFMADQSMLSFGPMAAAGYGLQTLIGIAAIALWLIVSTIAAPIIIQKAITNGAQAGLAFLSSVTTAGVAAITAGVTSAANTATALGSSTSGSTIAASAAGSLVGGAAAATALMGSSISGSTYSPSASAIGSLGSHLRSKAPKKQPYRSDDPANDQQVRELLNRSRS